MADVAAIYDLGCGSLFRAGEPRAGCFSQRAVCTDFHTARFRDVCDRTAADIFRAAYTRANLWLRGLLQNRIPVCALSGGKFQLAPFVVPGLYLLLFARGASIAALAT